MSGLLPKNIAIVTLGGHGARLGQDLRGALPGARLHGPRAYAGNWDESYDRISLHLASLFQAGQSIIGVCASGILIRAIAPFLSAKGEEPPVVAVAEDGSVAVPLLGGHRGANALARAGPMSRGSNQVPPQSGTSPILMKACTKVAERAARTMSQAKAMFAPAPAAMPFTAATTGKGSARSLRTSGL